MRGMICLFLMFFFVQGALAETPVERGRYLVEVIAACGNCHSRDFPGSPDQSMHLAGGFPIYGPWGVSVSSNITPTGLRNWSDQEIKTVITTGKRPNGTTLRPPMGVSYYAGLTEHDLDAIVAYLRSLPPR